MKRHVLQGICATILTFFAMVPVEAATIHVKAGAGGEGTSWADARPSLQDGLAAAVAGDEIWIAVGVYQPDQGAGLIAGDRGATFVLKPGVTLRGGFAGTETLAAQRGSAAGKTILSGDLAGDDGPGFTAMTDNSLHVVKGQGGVIVLDTLTITGGNAAGSPDSDDRGGGIFLAEATLEMSNCTVRHNQAARSGGGLFLANAGATLTGCLIDANEAMYGGGLAAYGNTLTLRQTTFADNHAANSGGAVDSLYAQGLIVDDSRFSGNSAGFQGAGIAADFLDSLSIGGTLFEQNRVTGLLTYNGGGGLHSRSLTAAIDRSTFAGNTTSGSGGGLNAKVSSSLTITNTTLRANHADGHGGGLFSAGPAFITNCTVIANSAAGGGGLSLTAATTMSNAIVWGNTAAQGAQLGLRLPATGLAVMHSDIQGGLAAIDNQGIIVTYLGNLDADPLLTADGHLRATSPCLGAADAATATTIDIDGELRPAMAGFDIGADEFKDSDGDGLPDFWETSHGLSAGDNGSVIAANGAAGDPDGDGRSNILEYLDATPPESGDNDGDGYDAIRDCNDRDRAVHPGAPEICDGIDNNCDGRSDDADPAIIGRRIWHRDSDGDGYGNGAVTLAACSQPAGYTADRGDCDDTKPQINPGAAEVCDGVDNNCDNRIDDAEPGAVSTTWYLDSDGDGYGTTLLAKSACSKPAGWSVLNNDCNAANPLIYPGAVEICGDGLDNNCNGIVDGSGECTSMACLYDAQCNLGEYCKKDEGTCNGVGACQNLPSVSTQCQNLADPICGCDGKQYSNACEAERLGVSVAAHGQCATTGYKWPYYFPSVKDNDGIGWENYLSVQAKDPVPMAVTIRVYDMDGKLAGSIIYSDTDPAARAKSIAPNARVATRPSLIAGGAIEGSIIVETSVPAIASTNCIASYYKGFSIYEAAKVKPVHYFPKAFDGPDNYQVYMTVQNIFPEPRLVTAVLSGKTSSSPGHGANQTITIPAYGTWKFRPSDIAGGINFDGSVGVYSDLTTPRDGLGPPIPAMCRYEAGTEALAIYESAARQPRLFFPVLKDGTFGGSLDYQNYLSVVNMNPQAATVTIVLYNKSGTEAGRLANNTIAAGGKKTWRPSWIKGTGAVPLDFEGLAVVISDQILVGQTNSIYPGTNKYGADAFDLFESAMRNKTLFFPKAYDNLPGAGIGETHLLDNYVYVSNSDGNTKSLKIEQFNNNGTANGAANVELPPYATHVFRPKALVTDNSGVFRGSVRVTEQSGLSITGAIKYEIHKTTDMGSGIEAMTIYRSMGQ